MKFPKAGERYFQSRSGRRGTSGQFEKQLKRKDSSKFKGPKPKSEEHTTRKMEDTRIEEATGGGADGNSQD